VADRHLPVVRLTALLLTGVLALTGCASAPDLADEGFNGTEIKNAWAAPDLALRSADGAAYSLTEQTTKPLTLVFFGYTNCPDICSMVMANITSALARLDEADREKVDVTFVTTDPARDDAAALERYLGAFDDSYVGLTGPMADVREVARAFFIHFAQGRKLPSGGYELEHDDHVFVVDGDDRIPLLWQRDTSPEQLAADLQLLLED
jgi:protein SCO1/2